LGCDETFDRRPLREIPEKYEFEHYVPIRNGTSFEGTNKPAGPQLYPVTYIKLKIVQDNGYRC
jgi:hypothetical protein